MALNLSTQPIINALWGVEMFYTRAGTNEEFSLTGTVDERGESEGVTSYGVYTIRKEVVTIAIDALDGNRPALRDTLYVDDDEAITRVVSGDIRKDPFLGQYIFDVSYPSLAADLDQTATVERAHGNAVPTSMGLKNPNLAAVYMSIAVRLQPDTRVRELDAAARAVTRSKFVCVFGAAVTLFAGDIVEVNSVKYEVTEQSEIESLGLLTFAAVERID